jgi:hypothetical protein
MLDGFTSQRHQLPLAPGLFGAVTELEHRKKGYLDFEMDLGVDSRVCAFRRVEDRVGTDPVTLVQDRESSIAYLLARRGTGHPRLGSEAICLVCSLERSPRMKSTPSRSDPQRVSPS